MRHLIFVLLIAFGFSGCSYTIFKGNGRPSTEPPKRINPDAKVSYEFLAANIFEKHCNECHSGAFADADYDTSTFSGALKHVKVGDPQGSLLYKVLISDDPKTRMPRRASPLSGAEIQLVFDWIKDGAVEKDEKPVETEPPKEEPPKDNPGDGGGGEVDPPTFTQLLDTVLQPRCAECHEGEFAEAELDVTNAESILGFVIAGNPEESVLYESLIEEDERKRMPRKAPPLPQAELDKVFNWIKAGAKVEE